MMQLSIVYCSSKLITNYHSKKATKSALYITKTHQKLLTVAASFGFADMVLSLEITLTTFPSTTGTAYSNNLENVRKGKVYQCDKSLQNLLTFLKAIDAIAPAVYSPIPLILRRSETVSGNLPPPSTTSFAPCKNTDIYNKQIQISKYNNKHFSRAKNAICNILAVNFKLITTCSLLICSILAVNFKSITNCSFLVCKQFDTSISQSAKI